MPTNKLWLEHTEKAAWESVQALREKLADAEKRMQRLAPPVEGWQPLLDALDAAKSELALEGATFADTVLQLVERSRRDAERLRSVEQELVDLRNASLLGAVLPRRTYPSNSVEFDEDDVGEPTRDSFGDFERALRRRHRAMQTEGAPSGVDEILARIEAKLEEMVEVDDSEIPEAAVDLGALAYLLSNASRKGAD